MLHLNDDCLCAIFEYLTLVEQLTITKVCVRFQDVITTSVWNNKYRKIYTCGPPSTGVSVQVRRAMEEVAALNKDNYQDFFVLNVNNVKLLDIGNTSRYAFSSYLGRHIDRPEFAFYFSFSYVRLKELNCQDMNFHDGHMRLVAAHCPLLETLQISSQYVTGKHMNRLRKLRRLIAFRCQLHAYELNAALRDLRCLRFMDLRWNLDLEEHALNSWGQHLRELHICEKQFLKQFATFPLPAHLGAIRLLCVICDDTPTSVAPEWFAYREGWVRIFKHCGRSIQVLKLFLRSEAMFDRLEHVYMESHQAPFPLMEVLHLKVPMPSERLHMLFMSTKIRSLYLYNTFQLDKTLELIQNSTQLNYIEIEDNMRNVHKLSEFIRNARRLLETLPNHPDITLSLKEVTCAPIQIKQELESKLGPTIFLPQARLKITISSCPSPTEYQWGRLDFQFFDETPGVKEFIS